MRIIFSRKGFDSGSGGKPSPIVNNRPISLPIPTKRRSATTYDDLGLGNLVEAVTSGKIVRDNLCHNDPYFADGKWAFGQTGSAQSHLKNQGVDVGDFFLFFGLFKEEGGDPHHRIYGYMRIETVLHLGASADAELCPDFALDHPHFIGEWNENNTIYLGRGGLCHHASTSLRLTRQHGPISQWVIPDWVRDYGLSYHSNEARWLNDGHLNSVARGQEFVCDVVDSQKAKLWLDSVIDEVDRPTSANQGSTGAKAPIIIVMLRQPKMNNPSEKRSDPFWEFGSFGCTGCHRKNLMNPRRAHELEGSRLAFVQGGADSVRLVHLTPPVTIDYHTATCELRWQPVEMPLRFEHAPVLISNSGFSDTPAIEQELKGVSRSTPVSQFASKFRSRRNPVEAELAAQIELAYVSARHSQDAVADNYEEALQFPPPLIDRDRETTYRALLAKA